MDKDFEEYANKIINTRYAICGGFGAEGSYLTAKNMKMDYFEETKKIESNTPYEYVLEKATKIANKVLDSDKDKMIINCRFEKALMPIVMRIYINGNEVKAVACAKEGWPKRHMPEKVVKALMESL